MVITKFIITWVTAQNNRILWIVEYYANFCHTKIITKNHNRRQCTSELSFSDCQLLPSQLYILCGIFTSYHGILLKTKLTALIVFVFIKLRNISVFHKFQSCLLHCDCTVLEKIEIATTVESLLKTKSEILPKTEFKIFLMWI